MTIKRLLTLVLLVATPSLAADLYVDISDPGCSNSTTRANNNAAQPWCHLARATWGSTNQGSPNVSECAQPGDVVHVLAGTYTMSGLTNPMSGTSGFIPIYNPARSGTSGNYITFMAEGGRVILEGPPNNTSEASGQPLVGMSGRNYIKWIGDGADGWWYIDTQDMDMRRGYGPVTAHSCSYFELSRFEVNGYTMPAGWDGEIVDAIRMEYATNGEVHNNLLYGTHLSNSHVNGAAIMLYDSEDIEIHHNEMYDNDAGVFVKVRNTRVNVHHNLIYNTNTRSISLLGANYCTVYQNVIYDSEQFCFEVYGWPDPVPTHSDIVNNTCYNGANAGIYLKLAGDGYWVNMRYYNNIISTVSGELIQADSSNEGDIAFDYNVHHAYGSFSNEFTWAGWQSGGQDTHSLTSNPLFANASVRDLRLCTASGTPDASCSGASPVIALGMDILDLDQDGSTTDRIPAGAYITGSEIIGLGGASSSGGGSTTTPPGTVPGFQRADTYTQ